MALAKRLTISGTAFERMLVWNGDYHEVELRVLDPDDPCGTRWVAQEAVQNAAGFPGLRRFTNEVAYRRRWHRFPIKRRRLARRFMIQIEPLVREGLVAVRLDGERVRVGRSNSGRTEN